VLCITSACADDSPGCEVLYRNLRRRLAARNVFSSSSPSYLTIRHCCVGRAACPSRIASRCPPSLLLIILNLPPFPAERRRHEHVRRSCLRLISSRRRWSRSRSHVASLTLAVAIAWPLPLCVHHPHQPRRYHPGTRALRRWPWLAPPTASLGAAPTPSLASPPPRTPAQSHPLGPHSHRRLRTRGRASSSSGTQLLAILEITQSPQGTATATVPTNASPTIIVLRLPKAARLVDNLQSTNRTILPPGPRHADTKRLLSATQPHPQPLPCLPSPGQPFLQGVNQAQHLLSGVYLPGQNRESAPLRPAQLSRSRRQSNQPRQHQPHLARPAATSFA
jgi:hypothetical protein